MILRGNRPRNLTTELLIEPIVLRVPNMVTDGEGGFTTTFSNGTTLWGMFVPVQQDRVLNELSLSFNLSARVYIRYPLTFDNTYKLRINTVDYTIHSIVDIENKKQFYEITCYA